MLRVRLFDGRRRVFDGPARQVLLPGAEGEVGVMGFHAPMLCALAEGEVVIDGAPYPVRRGLARVDRDTVTILC